MAVDNDRGCTERIVCAAGLLLALGLAIPGVFSPVLGDSPSRRPAGLAPQLVPGAEVEVKGKLLTDGSLLADRIEMVREGEGDQVLRGVIESVNPQARSLKILGFTIEVRPETRLTREPEQPAQFDDLVPGLRVKVEVLRSSEGTWLAKKVRIRQSQYPEQKIAGPVEAVAPSGVGQVVLWLLGRPVVVNGATELVPESGPSRPAVLVGFSGGDEDDLLITGRNRIGKHLALLGEARFRYEVLLNPDLDQSTRDGEQVHSQFGIVGLLAEFGTFLAYFEMLGEHEHGFPVEDGSDDEAGSVRGSQAYVGATNFPIPGLSLAVGRQKFFESRRWYYDTKNLDAIRLFGSRGPVTFQASVSRDVFDQQRNPRDRNTTNRIAEVRWDLARDLALEGFYLEREDRTVLHDSPRIFGLRVSGDPGTHVEFWADLAREGGTRGQVDPVTSEVVVREVRAHALDVGLTYRPRVALDPSFTASFAFGSGDDDPVVPVGQQSLGRDGTFRQSGLQRNRGSLNGVISFRYYGEVLDPELTNLRIQTLGVGLRPVRPLSLDLLFHRYHQDVPSSRIENAELDADPSGLDPYLGSEWDFALGYEPAKTMELRLTGGYFLPGRAFPQDATPATIATFQVKFRF